MAASDAFYNELLPEIIGAISEFGTEYDIRGPGVYDEDTMTRTPPTSRKVKGLVSDQRIATSLSGTMASSDAVSPWVATKTLILDPNAAPKDEEEIQVDGQWFSLSKIAPVKPADITLLYMLDVSR